MLPVFDMGNFNALCTGLAQQWDIPDRTILSFMYEIKYGDFYKAMQELRHRGMITWTDLLANKVTFNLYDDRVDLHTPIKQARLTVFAFLQSHLGDTNSKANLQNHLRVIRGLAHCVGTSEDEMRDIFCKVNSNRDLGIMMLQELGVIYHAEADNKTTMGILEYLQEKFRL